MSYLPNMREMKCKYSKVETIQLYNRGVGPQHPSTSSNQESPKNLIVLALFVDDEDPPIGSRNPN